MSQGWKVAVLGATGAVGTALIELLQEREFPIGELFPLASENSAGESVRVNGKSVMVTDAEQFDWSQAELAFFVAGKETSLRFAEEAANQGCLIIDSTGAFTDIAEIPLIVPSVNPHALCDYRNRNIVAVADSTTSQLLTAIKPLIDDAGIGRLHVTSLLSASALGKAAVDDLAGQSARLLNGLPVEETMFAKQLAFNMLPLAIDEEGNVAQERLLVDQIRKVLADDGLPISVSCVQAPVFYGHAQMVHMEGLRPVDAQEAKTILENCDDIIVADNDDMPTQVTEASGNSALTIGCMRNDYGIPSLLQFWSVADNVRFGGALMAVETAERLIEEMRF